MFKLIIALSLVLQTGDILITIIAGGLAVEGNPWARFLWNSFGILAIFAVKGLSFAVFTFSWRRIKQRFPRFILGAYFVTVPLVTVTLNAITILSWRIQ